MIKWIGWLLWWKSVDIFLQPPLSLPNRFLNKVAMVGENRLRMMSSVKWTFTHQGWSSYSNCWMSKIPAAGPNRLPVWCHSLVGQSATWYNLIGIYFILDHFHQGKDSILSSSALSLILGMGLIYYDFSFIHGDVYRSRLNLLHICYWSSPAPFIKVSVFPSVYIFDSFSKIRWFHVLKFFLLLLFWPTYPHVRFCASSTLFESD